MRKLLFISHAFPPSLLPESVLVLKTVRALEKCGWDITVLTTAYQEHASNYADADLIKFLPQRVQVIRLRSWEGTFKNRSIMAKIIRRALFSLGLPEIDMMWLPSVLFSIKSILAKGQYDVIHSWASPHTSNIAGLITKRMSRLPWVAHFSDPWVDNPYNAYFGIQYQTISILEKAIACKADAIVFITKQTAELVMDKYKPEWGKKAHVIPHGYDTGMSGDITLNKPERKRMRLVYVGSFYQGRTPETLLRAMHVAIQDAAIADKVELALVGPNARDYAGLVSELGLDDIVICSDPVPFKESIRTMADSDVLLIIDAPVTVNRGINVFLPSKLVDYLMLGKPILGITPLQGASADLLRSLYCPVVAPTDIPQVAKVIIEMVQAWSRGTLSLADDSIQIIKEYDIQRTTAILDKLLNNTKLPVKSF